MSNYDSDGTMIDDQWSEKRKPYTTNMSAFLIDAQYQIEDEILFDILEKIAIKYEDYYVFNYASYRKLIYYNLFESFAEKLKPYYIKKRQFYITKRPITYNMVTTIIRQLCALKQIDYKITTIYKSKTQEYRIYMRKKNGCGI